MPDGLLTKAYKDIVNGYHNENCWMFQWRLSSGAV